MAERSFCPVPRCDPPLASMPGLVAELNESRAFYKFLKHVRSAFKTDVEEEQALARKKAVADASQQAQ